MLPGEDRARPRTSAVVEPSVGQPGPGIRTNLASGPALGVNKRPPMKESPVRKSNTGVKRPSEADEKVSREQKDRIVRTKKHDAVGELYHTGKWYKDENGQDREEHRTSVCYCMRPCCWAPTTPVSRRRTKQEMEDREKSGHARAGDDEKTVQRYTGYCVCWGCDCGSWRPTSTLGITTHMPSYGR